MPGEPRRARDRSRTIRRGSASRSSRLIYGNDWFVAPVDVDALGTLTLVERVWYTTTFGERIFVPQADDAGARGGSACSRVTAAGRRASARGLLPPPSARGVSEGGALEEVCSARRGGRMAWAVEAHGAGSER